jgi:hypothetical protein
MTRDEAIRGLVCGLPEPQRSRRRLLMLRAFCDESESYPPEPQVFVLAGYIARPARWEAFSDEWRQALDEKPSLATFKFKEAWKLSGQFRHWSEESRNAKVQLLSDIIARHAEAELSVAFRPEVYRAVYREVFGERDRFAKHPLCFAIVQLSVMVSQGLEQLGLPREQVDFVFDNHAMAKDKVLAEWDGMAALTPYLRSQPADLRTKIMVNPPSFADDAQVMPLQAADMLAGIMRVAYVNAMKGQETTRFPWAITTGQMARVQIQFNEDQLRQTAREVHAVATGFRRRMARRPVT